MPEKRPVPISSLTPAEQRIVLTLIAAERAHREGAEPGREDAFLADLPGELS